MKECVIFGAGFTGQNAYFKLSTVYHVLAYADNNRELWGRSIHGITVIDPKELTQYQCDVIICSDYFSEIQKQLLELGVKSIRMIEPDSYMLYEYMPHNMMKPVNGLSKYSPYQKQQEGLHILFVQQHPCIRTHKIAEILYERRILVSIAYTAEPPEYRHPHYAAVYTNKMAFFSIEDFIGYVNESEYDLVHCSNEPDHLTNILLASNKPVVHDTHDFMSLCYQPGRDMLALEYLANTKSHGQIYVNEYNLQLAAERFGINTDYAVVIENRPSKVSMPESRLTKLSTLDHEIHCVYEGGIHKNPGYFRYVEDIWMQIAENGVHVHFYTQTDPQYCRQIEQRHQNIHYEGYIDSSKLVTELTKYDCGLLLFQDLPEYRLLLDTALPNKIYEYLAAGLPEVVGDVKAHKEFVERYAVGCALDFSKDIKEQISKAADLKIEDHFIQNHKLTMASQADCLIDFYYKIISRHRKERQ